MPHDTTLIGTVVAGLGVAFLMGALAHRLKISPIAGYLLAGILVGPFTPGFVADTGLAMQLAGRKLPDGSRLFSDATARELTTMVTPMPAADPPPELPVLQSDFSGYALGFGLSEYRGHKLVQHTGGLPGYELVSVQGLFGPAKMPEAAVARLNQEIVPFLQRAEVKEKFFAAGMEPLGSPPEALAATVRSEMARLGKVIQGAGIKLEAAGG